MIAEHLRRLAGALDAVGVRGSDARRVLAEARSHLQESAVQSGEDEAVRAFGPAWKLAELVAGELATARTRTAAFDTFVALAVTGLAYGAIAFVVGRGGGWPDIASGEVPALGVAAAFGIFLFPQVTFVAGCLALVKPIRARHAAALGGAELALIRRRSAVALVGGALTLGSWALWAVEFRFSFARLHPWWAPGEILVVTSALAIVLIAAAVQLSRSGRSQPLPGSAAGDLFDELAPVCFGSRRCAGLRFRTIRGGSPSSVR